MDIFLKPMVANLPSYIRDTKHILGTLSDITWERDMTVVTLVVTALYTSIKRDCGLKAIRKVLNTRSASTWEHTEMLITKIELILDYNVFLFKDKWFCQKQGMAMGSRFSPSYANLFMGWLEETWIWGPKGIQWTDYFILGQIQR